MSITIEPGKAYRARSGERWTDPELEKSKSFSDGEWSLKDATGNRYAFRADGSFCCEGADGQNALVAEWADEAPRNEDPTPLCDLGKHVRGSNDICIVCGATPEQVNEQARVAMPLERNPMLDDLDRATRLAADYREKTGRGGMGEPLGAEALTNERKSTHGNWSDQAVVGVMLDQAVQDSTGYGNLAAYQRKAIDMILVKVSRIVSGDPSHEDHWDDIAGYAYLGKGGHKSA